MRNGKKWDGEQKTIILEKKRKTIKWKNGGGMERAK